LTKFWLNYKLHNLKLQESTNYMWNSLEQKHILKVDHAPNLRYGPKTINSLEPPMFGDSTT